MKIISTNIEGLKIIEPNLITDNRGYFFESFNKKKFNLFFENVDFVQDNESRSSFGTLRGLHFQREPYAQSKLVRVTKGEVLDVVVDLRSKSKTFGEFERIILSEKNKRQIFIPKGFAHGFIVLSDYAIFNYKVDNHYMPEYDSGLKWDDKQLNIDWIIEKDKIISSEKDNKLMSFEKFKLMIK